jgi:putative PIN family toxin of toxin-antitoxin system
MTTPIQVVIDTNVCLDLFVFNDPRWAILLSGLKDGNIKAMTRDDCREEWLAVLHYPHLPINDTSRVQTIIAFDEFISCVAPIQKSILLPKCSDKDDQKFLEIARDVGAETLITKDKALLKLARKIKQTAGFSIDTPERFIAKLISTSTEV